MKQRQTELDILRFLATLSVIVIHAGRIPYVSSCMESFSFEMTIVPFTWCVPIFFMISGRFFLDGRKPISLCILFRKNIFRILLAFLLWSAVYTAYYIGNGTYKDLNIFGLLTQYIKGPTHFWFLYTLVGLYLITPLLRKLVQDERICLYVLVLFTILNITTQYLIYLPKIGDIIAFIVDSSGLNLISGYAGCFLLGHILYTYRDRITPKWELIIYTAGLAMLVLTCFLDTNISEDLQQADFVKQYQKPNVIFYSSAIFLFFIKRISCFHFSDSVRKLFAKTTEYGFGVYIIHALVIEFFAYIPFRKLESELSTIIVLVPLCIYLISFTLTALIRKIPGVGKYLL